MVLLAAGFSVASALAASVASCDCAIDSVLVSLSCQARESQLDLPTWTSCLEAGLS